jgi:hypothetical protein
MMRTLQILVLVGWLTVARTVFAAGGPFGLGLMVGEPTGLSAKAFLADSHAVDAALSWSFVDDALYVHADYLLHFPGLFGRGMPGAPRHQWLPYVGIGGKVLLRDDRQHPKGEENRNRLGARVPFGLAWHPPRVPIDVFLEVVPSLVLLPETDFDLDAGLGVRYYF